MSTIKANIWMIIRKDSTFGAVALFNHSIEIVYVIGGYLLPCYIVVIRNNDNLMHIAYLSIYI